MPQWCTPPHHSHLQCGNARNNSWAGLEASPGGSAGGVQRHSSAQVDTSACCLHTSLCSTRSCQQPVDDTTVGPHPTNRRRIASAGYHAGLQAMMVGMCPHTPFACRQKPGGCSTPWPCACKCGGTHSLYCQGISNAGGLASAVRPLQPCWRAGMGFTIVAFLPLILPLQ